MKPANNNNNNNINTNDPIHTISSSPILRIANSTITATTTTKHVFSIVSISTTSTNTHRRSTVFQALQQQENDFNRALLLRANKSLRTVPVIKNNNNNQVQEVDPSVNFNSQQAQKAINELLPEAEVINH